MKALTWVKEHAGIVITAVLGIVGFVLGGLFVSSLRRPDKLVKNEIDRVQTGKAAAQDAIRVGADVAVAKLEVQHAETIKALDDGQKAKADTLKEDPKALAQYLTDLSNKD